MDPQSTFLTLMCIPSAVLIYLVIWGLVFQTSFGLKRYRQLYKGYLSSKQYNALLYSLFSAKDLHYDGYHVEGGGYKVWVAKR